MKYNIEITKKARKAYLKLPEDVRRLVYTKLGTLANDGHRYGCGDIKPIKGEKGCYRLRVGVWRVIYRLHNSEAVLEVIRIAHRKEVYR